MSISSAMVFSSRVCCIANEWIGLILRVVGVVGIFSR